MRALLSIAAIVALAACPSKTTPSASDAPEPSADTAAAPEPEVDTATAPEPEADTATAPEPEADTATAPEPETDTVTAEPSEDTAGATAGETEGPKPLTDEEKADLVKNAATFKKLLNEGRKLVKGGDYETAVKAYRAALALNPTNASVLGELGFAALKQGDLDLAEELTRRAISYSRGGKQLGALQYNIGQIFEKRDLPGDALVAYRASLAARPGNEVVAGRVAALEAMENPKARAARVYPTLKALAGAQVLGCLDYVGVWDEAPEIPRDLTPDQAVEGIGPCEVTIGGTVKAPEGNAPVTEVAFVAAGTSLYSTIDLAMHVEGGWIVGQRVFENENSGCCGAYREFKAGDPTFREVVPGHGAEVVFDVAWEDQDSDMGDNYIYHRSYEGPMVCGMDEDGGWCRAVHARELSYGGDLDKFLEGVAGSPRCWEVSFDGEGKYTRKPVACKGGEAPDEATPVTGEVLSLPLQ